MEPGEAAEAEELNILAQLRPFLSEQPPSTDPPPLRAAQAPAADSQKDAVVRPSVQTDAANEEQAVRAYVAANGQAVSLPTAGVQLLSSLSAQKWEEGAGVISKQILALVSALGPSWRPEGTSAPPSSRLCTLFCTCQSITHLRCMATQSAFCPVVKSQVKDCLGPLDWPDREQQLASTVTSRMRFYKMQVRQR